MIWILIGKRSEPSAAINTWNFHVCLSVCSGPAVDLLIQHRRFLPTALAPNMLCMLCMLLVLIHVVSGLLSNLGGKTSVCMRPGLEATVPSMLASLDSRPNFRFYIVPFRWRSISEKSAWSRGYASCMISEVCMQTRPPSTDSVLSLDSQAVYFPRKK